MDMRWYAVLAWYGAMSFIAVVLYWRDKRCAQRGAWRIPEQMLHFVALLGGWPGAFFAQRILRHKIRKRWFQMVTFLIVLVHVAAWIAVQKKFL